VNKQMLYQILDDLATEAVPVAGNPWETIQKRFFANKKMLGFKNASDYKVRISKKHHWAAVTGMLIFFLVFVMMISLPQGRAWAQELLQFFVRGPDQIILPTPLPVNLVNITPGTVQPTLTPITSQEQGFAFYDFCGSLPEPSCSGEEIRDMVDFPIKGIADLSADMQFIGATGGPEAVTLVYQYGEPNSVTLLLHEGPATDAARQAVQVGSSAVVEQVQINNALGEYVKGTYFSYGGDATASWTEDFDLQSLRWEEDGMLYTLTMMGQADLQSVKLDKTGLINLAASLNAEAKLSPKKSITEETESVAEVEKKAGFPIKEPEWLPQGLQLKKVTYLADQKAICLEYTFPVDQLTDAMPDTSVSILESAEMSPPDLKDLVFTNLQPEQVLLKQSTLKVGGAIEGTGLYAFGSIDGSRVCGSRMQNQVLEVQMEGLNITILAKENNPFGSTSRDWLTKQEMVRLAEGITGIQTIKENQIDPEFLTSLTVLQQVAQFPLKLATKLPEGMNFYYAQFEQNGEQQEAQIHYSDSNHETIIRQIKDSQDTLQELIRQNPEIYHPVTVHGQSAILSQGYWDQDGWRDFPDGGDGSASVIWFEDGIEYIVGGFNAYSDEIWLEIAESLK